MNRASALVVVASAFVGTAIIYGWVLFILWAVGPAWAQLLLIFGPLAVAMYALLRRI